MVDKTCFDLLKKSQTMLACADFALDPFVQSALNILARARA